MAVKSKKSPPAPTMVKGNIVAFEKGGTVGMVLAVRKDGSRALVYRYGPDFENWVPLDWLTVTTSGSETCYKCGGSGLYYYGGMVLNGVYQGKTGVCFGCEGDGMQTDADRLRCHHYWHRKVDEGDSIESPIERSPQPEGIEAAEVKPDPLAAEPQRPQIRSRKKRK